VPCCGAGLPLAGSAGRLTRLAARAVCLCLGHPVPVVGRGRSNRCPHPAPRWGGPSQTAASTQVCPGIRWWRAAELNRRPRLAFADAPWGRGRVKPLVPTLHLPAAGPAKPPRLAGFSRHALATVAGTSPLGPGARQRVLSAPDPAPASFQRRAAQGSWGAPTSRPRVQSSSQRRHTGAHMADPGLQRQAGLA
jgi:hypothetical protein